MDGGRASFDQCRAMDDVGLYTNYLMTPLVKIGARTHDLNVPHRPRQQTDIRDGRIVGIRDAKNDAG